MPDYSPQLWETIKLLRQYHNELVMLISNEQTGLVTSDLAMEIIGEMEVVFAKKLLLLQSEPRTKTT